MGGVAPAEFPPPVNPAEEFVGPPTDPEDERIEVGVAIVGGGPAGLACAIKLTQLLEHEPAAAGEARRGPGRRDREGQDAGRAPAVGREHAPVGDAGAVPRPGRVRRTGPSFGRSTKDAVYLLTEKQALPLKPMPPNFRNHGNYVTSVAQLGRFLSEKAEEAGVYVLSETAAEKLLVEDRIVDGRAHRRQGPRPRRRAARPTSSPAPT